MASEAYRKCIAIAVGLAAQTTSSGRCGQPI